MLFYSTCSFRGIAMSIRSCLSCWWYSSCLPFQSTRMVRFGDSQLSSLSLIICRSLLHFYSLLVWLSRSLLFGLFLPWLCMDNQSLCPVGRILTRKLAAKRSRLLSQRQWWRTMFWTWSRSSSCQKRPAQEWPGKSSYLHGRLMSPSDSQLSLPCSGVSLDLSCIRRTAWSTDSCKRCARSNLRRDPRRKSDSYRCLRSRSCPRSILLRR